MKPLTLDELRELAPAFVMGTLSPDERAHFNAAMADPAVAAEMAPEIEAHRAAMDFLASSQAVTPPPSLKARVAQRIADEQAAAARQRSMHMAETAEIPATEPLAPAALSTAEPSVTPVPTPAPTPTPTPMATPSAAGPVIHRATRTPPYPQAPVRRAGGVLPWATAGVCALAMAASVALLVRTQTEVKTLRTDLAAERKVVERITERLASRDSTVDALTAANSDLTLVRLVSNEVSAPAMQVFWNRRRGTAVVHASGFAQVAKDRAYCLWIIRNGKPQAVAMFTPDADGEQLLNSVAVPLDAANIAAFAVTEEPAGGSPQPTMTPFLVGAVAPK